MSQRSKYCLVGIPDHQGVLNVGGRIGASSGPAAFRRAFSRLNGRAQIRALLHDAGDVSELGSDAAANHREAARWIAREHRASELSVVVGGGHDHGYSHLLGIRDAYSASTSAARGKKKLRLGCINIDAHLDVRKPEPIVTSGSPFYVAIESGLLDPTRFVEFGIQSHCNAPALWEYIDRKKITVVPFEKLRAGRAAAVFKQTLDRLSAECDLVVVSLDLDAAAQAYAPGVSAPQAEGFTSTEILEMVEIAGRSRKVCSLGIFELNPVHDIDDRTAKLAATAAWHFLEQTHARPEMRKAPRR